MEKNKKLELTEGSEYKITSLGSRDNLIETSGVLMELNSSHGDMAGKLRIVPLHVILLIDVLNIKENEKKDDFKGMSHYVG